MKGKSSALLVLGLLTIVAVGETVLAQKASVPKSQDKFQLGEEEVKRLVLLMDTDKNGKISKQEFMTFMESEFERLDKNHDEELDVKELTRSEIQGRRFISPPSSAEEK